MDHDLEANGWRQRAFPASWPSLVITADRVCFADQVCVCTDTTSQNNATLYARTPIGMGLGESGHFCAVHLCALVQPLRFFTTFWRIILVTIWDREHPQGQSSGPEWQQPFRGSVGPCAHCEAVDTTSGHA